MLATTQDKVKSKQFSQVQAVSELHEEFFFFTFFFKIFFLMWTIFFFKSLFNLLTTSLLFCFGFFGPGACGILAPLPGIEPTPLYWKVNC